MTDLLRARWGIHSEVLDGSVCHSVWSGSKRIAGNIGSIEEASIVRAAPELLAFAQTIVRLMRSHPTSQPSLAIALEVCRNIIETAQLPCAPPSSDLSHAQADTADVLSKISNTPPRPLFDELFKAALDEIRDEALRSGWTLQHLAKHVGISRAQFTRWRKCPPVTIKAVAKLQAALRAGVPG